MNQNINVATVYEYSSIKRCNLKRYIHYDNNIKIDEFKVSTNVGFGTNMYIYISMIFFISIFVRTDKKC